MVREIALCDIRRQTGTQNKWKIPTSPQIVKIVGVELRLLQIIGARALRTNQQNLVPVREEQACRVPEKPEPKNKDQFHSN